MHLRIDIDCDNAESNGEIQDQITDTLNEIARRIGRLKPSPAPWPLFDADGNDVGSVTVTERAEPDAYTPSEWITADVRRTLPCTGGCKFEPHKPHCPAVNRPAVEEMAHRIIAKYEPEPDKLREALRSVLDLLDERVNGADNGLESVVERARAALSSAKGVRA
jgi:hypothetical protein